MKQVHTKLLRVALGATFLFATMLMAIPVRAANCKDVTVLFMRGSSQNYTPHNNEDINFPDWVVNTDGKIQFNDYRYDKTNDKEPAFVTYEKESVKYFTNIGNRIRSEYPTLTYQFVSLHDIAGKYNANGYRAVPAFGSAPFYVSRNALDAKYGSSAVIAESVYGDYNQSIADGAEELAGYLQDEMVRCPSMLPIVGGFSQGAHVVGEAMKLLHDRGKDNLLSRMGHVDLYGDPKFNGYEQVTNRLNPLKKHVTLPWTRGSANQLHTGSLGPRKPYVPDILFDKTTSWCDALDVVCGGAGALNVFAASAHGEVYRKDGGYIDQSANEIYIAVKPRLTKLAGVSDKSANSPLAYWDGIKKPKKIDVVFVMDRTGDENISLQPDPSYIQRNFVYLAQEAGYSSFSSAVVTYTEFSRYDGQKDVIESVVKTPVAVTEDIFSDYSPFADQWGRAHFQNPPYGGEDLQDSPFSALNTALELEYRSDAKKVIVLFSNSYGKEKEETTNLTLKQVTAKAKKKKVTILPVFTSKTFRSSSDYVQKVPAANAFWSALAKQSGGHYTEITDGITERLLYDVIMKHIFAPDVEISMGTTYNTPKTATTNKTTAPSTVKQTKVVVAKNKKVVLSAAKSTSAVGKISSYNWDLNGDGTTDTSSQTPDVEFGFEDDFDGEVCVEVVDEEGNATTGCQEIATGDDTQVTHELPEELVAPEVSYARSSSNKDIVLSWLPTEGTLLFTNDEGGIIATTDATNGTFVLRDVPMGSFVINYQLILGNDRSAVVSLTITAAPQNDSQLAANEQLPQDGSQQGGTSSATLQLATAPDTTFSNVIGGGGSPPIQQPAVLSNNKQTTNLVALAVGVTKEKIASTFNTVALYIKSGGFKILLSLSIAALLQNIWLLLLLLLLLCLLLALLVGERRQQHYEHNKKHATKRGVFNTNTYMYTPRFMARS